MSEESSKDKDSVNRDPETPAADNNSEDSPGRTTDSSKDPADKSKSDKTPSKRTNPSDIDSLLSDVTASLDDLENQLGESSSDPAMDLVDTTGGSTPNRKITGGEKNMDLTQKSDKLDQVDSTLEELEKELSNLTEGINIEQDDAEVSSESETVQEKGSPCQEEISEDNIDDFLSQAAQEITEDEEIDEALSIIDQLPDLAMDSQEEEKTTDTQAQYTTVEVDEDTEESQAQRIVTEEPAEIEGKEQTSKQQPERTTIDDSGQFGLPQRVLIQSLETANKPFGFVPEGFKDTLGLIAVVTLLVATVAAVLILWASS